MLTAYLGAELGAGKSFDLIFKGLSDMKTTFMRGEINEKSMKLNVRFIHKNPENIRL
jgi:hypothetical protein